MIGVCITSAHADSLKPMHALSVDLGDRTAVAFYTRHNGAFEVVTTIGPNDGDSRIVRHVAILNRNQDYTVFLSGDHTGSPAQRINIRRSGSSIHIALGVSDDIITRVSSETPLRARPPMATF